MRALLRPGMGAYIVLLATVAGCAAASGLRGEDNKYQQWQPSNHAASWADDDLEGSTGGDVYGSGHARPALAAYAETPSSLAQGRWRPQEEGLLWQQEWTSDEAASGALPEEAWASILGGRAEVAEGRPQGVRSTSLTAAQLVLPPAPTTAPPTVPPPPPSPPIWGQVYVSSRSVSAERSLTVVDFGVIDLDCTGALGVYEVATVQLTFGFSRYADGTWTKKPQCPNANFYALTDRELTGYNVQWYGKQHVYVDPYVGLTDWCVNVQKQTTFAYKCVSAVFQTMPSSTSVHRWSGDIFVSCGADFTLQCPPGRSLMVTAAQYGRPSLAPYGLDASSFCPLPPATCASVDVKATVQAQAPNLNVASFPDPCFGVNKYLLVQAYCQ